MGIMGADAWWSRYEWQSRGSTHAHYFLWFRDAPDVSFLEDWTQQAMAKLPIRRASFRAPLGAPATRQAGQNLVVASP